MTEPIQFGDKYLLLDTLGTGGMAKIFRGKLIGDQGFEKIIVIKKLLNHLTEDQEMVKLFINEARLAALLQHDNIACVYDFGNIDGSYFIAMEYLFGKDLHTLLEKTQHQNQLIPPEFALYIASKICDAMGYAHNLTDLQNNKLNIIHRDLTPHNIFITYEGKVKVIDFGIAKNKFQDNKTEVGIVKGKISYMSPEQLAGSSIDHRADIFTIGVLLYEMLSGTKLYPGEITEVIQKAIKVDHTPLQEVVPGIPPQICAIVEKALSRDIPQRYQSCAQLQTDIEEYLFSVSKRVNTKSLKEFSLQLFQDEYEQESKNASLGNEPVVGATSAESADDFDKTEVIPTPSEQQTELHSGPLFEKTELFPAETDKDTTVNLDIAPEKAEPSCPSLEQKQHKTISKFVPITAGIAVTACIAMGTWLFTGKSHVELEEPLTPIVVEEQITQEQAPGETSLESEGTSLQKKIDSLLVSARKAAENDEHAESAYQYYMEVLLLDKGNEEAIKGLKKTSQFLHEKAQKEIAARQVEPVKDTLTEKSSPDNSKISKIKENLEQEQTIINLHSQALEQINKGHLNLAEATLGKTEQLFPNNPRTAQLKRTAQHEKNKVIQFLFNAAEVALNEERLTIPPEDCAFKYYSDIKDLDKDNQLYKDGFKKIADRYATLGTRYFHSMEMDKARRYVDRGLKVDPNHTRLKELNRDLGRVGIVPYIHSTFNNIGQAFINIFS